MPSKIDKNMLQKKLPLKLHDSYLRLKHSYEVQKLSRNDLHNEIRLGLSHKGRHKPCQIKLLHTKTEQNNKVNIIYGPCFKSYFMGNVVEELNGSLAGDSVRYWPVLASFS